MQPPYQQPQYPNTFPGRYPRPLEPTQAAYNINHDATTEQAYFNPYMNTPYELWPPPPPSRRNWSRGVLVGLVIVLLFTNVGLLFLYMSTNQKTIALIPTKVVTVLVTPSPSPLNANYTARDIMRDLQAAHLPENSLDFILHGQSIYAWSQNTYPTSDHFQSSATWSDASGCSGACDPASLGIWVYASAQDAMHTSIEVLQDEKIYGPVLMTGRTPGIVVHGRCLLLGTDAQSQYAHVIQTECV